MIRRYTVLMKSDRGNNGKTPVEWVEEVGLSAMKMFEQIMKHSFIYEGYIRWMSDIESRSILMREMKVSDIRIKQLLKKLRNSGLLIQEGKGKYKINERAANIMIIHPTKSGR